MLSFPFREPTFGQRLGGAVLDALLWLPFAALLAQLGRWLPALAVAAYEVGLVARDGQTIGKKLVGTRVVSVASGTTPTLRSAAVRWLAVIAIPLVVEGTGLPDPLDLGWTTLVFLPVLKPPLHRGLHDRAAATIVTSVRQPGGKPRTIRSSA
jgi:uncharacterized RDD family membrane protein YckC